VDPLRALRLAPTPPLPCSTPELPVVREITNPITARQLRKSLLQPRSLCRAGGVQCVLLEAAEFGSATQAKLPGPRAVCRELPTHTDTHTSFALPPLNYYPLWNWGGPKASQPHGLGDTSEPQPNGSPTTGLTSARIKRRGCGWVWCGVVGMGSVTPTPLYSPGLLWLVGWLLAQEAPSHESDGGDGETMGVSWAQPRSVSSPAARALRPSSLDYAGVDMLMCSGT
jgi:hypothetical protein